MIKTTAMFSAHVLHVLHVAVRDLFMLVVVLLAALFFWMLHGISIDKLTLGQYEVDGLYIKLDKKLTLNAQRVVIPKSKAKPSFERIDQTFDRIKHLLVYFESIYLEKVEFSNNHLTLFYADDVLYMTSDEYEIAGNIERKGSKLIADVSMLHIPAFDLTVSGSLAYDLSTHSLETGGTFSLYGIDGSFRAVKKGEEIIYALNTKRFTDLKPLIKRIALPEVIEAWIIDKVTAKFYKVDYVKGRFSLEDKDIERNLANMKAQAHFWDVDIRYKDGVQPVHAEEMTLNFKKGNLYFDLVDPRHKDRSAAGTTVQILHLIGAQRPVLILDLHVVSPIDEEVQKILRAYKLDIPVYHAGKKDNVVVTLKIPLGRDERKMRAKVDVRLDKGMLLLKELKLYVSGGHIVYENGTVRLEKVSITEPWFKGTVEGTIDVKHKVADLMLQTERFVLGDKADPVLLIKQKKIPLKLTYGVPLKADFPSLAITVKQTQTQLSIHLHDLGRLTPYLVDNILGIEGGDVTVTTKERRLYRFRGIVQKNDCFFYDSKNICYTKVPIEGSYNMVNGEVDLYAFDKRFHYNSKKSRVLLNGLNIDLKRFLAQRKKFQIKSKKHRKLSKKKLIIVGKKSQLRYNQHRLVTDSYDIEVFPNGDIKAIGSKDGDVVKFTKKGEIFSVQALRIKDTILHPLINFSGLKKGRYTLKKKGDPEKMMKGQILIEGGVLSDFKAYSNTLAFINTLPALATLNDPGFSQQGFKIEEGVIDYTMTPDKIVFDSVYLKGNSATVVGKGVVDLKTKQLHIDLAIQSVREFGKMVGSIPLVGYILMGDDKSMTVGLQISGTLDDPKVNTTVAQDILTLPLQ
ncbi:MAG: AsmA-like C-terminal domain-containing protein, partial [Sulfurovum sp.]|nr:AsmA-like C-terminal domain-containing protein [Sulfurovum sp.]